MALTLFLADRALEYIRLGYAERFPVGCFFIVRKEADTEL
jgi:hypothetical protein